MERVHVRLNPTNHLEQLALLAVRVRPTPCINASDLVDKMAHRRSRRDEQALNLARIRTEFLETLCRDNVRSICQLRSCECRLTPVLPFGVALACSTPINFDAWDGSVEYVDYPHFLAYLILVIRG